MKIKKKILLLPHGATTTLRFISNHSATTTILVLPALGVPASYYDVLLISLFDCNFSVACVDFHGQGESSIKANSKIDFGYKELLEIDIPVAIEATKKILSKQLFLFGHSLGGQMACLYAGQHQHNIKGIILCLSGSVFYKSWNGLSRYKVLIGTQFSILLSRFLGYFPGHIIGFGGKTGKQLIIDWGTQSRSGLYTIGKSNIDWENGLENIKLPILGISLDNDFMAPKGAMTHLCNKMKNARFNHIILKMPSFNHFRWARSPEPIIREVIKWENNLKEK